MSERHGLPIVYDWRPDIVALSTPIRTVGNLSAPWRAFGDTPRFPHIACRREN